MDSRIIEQADLLEWVARIAKDFKLIAPVDERTYGRAASADEVRLGGSKPAKSLKEFFFPDREVLFDYRVTSEGAELTAPLPDAPRVTRVVFGAHPCDIASLLVLDPLFSWDVVDSTYVSQRDNTVLVALACEEPEKACFCTSVGCSPTSGEGADLLLTPLGDVYHVRVLTERGEALVTWYESLFRASTEAYESQKEQFDRERQDLGTDQVDTTRLQSTMDFDDPVWDKLAERCVDCGICTFLCPTCHCFDIQDEGGPREGTRVRLWDACAFAEYTKTHAAQPRPTHNRRYRQRIMHKFKYYPENFGKVLCVGCGRCIQYCPVSIDLRKVLKRVEG